jgi:hypothetical protein
MISLDTISIESFHQPGPAWRSRPPLSPRDWSADGLSVAPSPETMDALPVHTVTCSAALTGCAVTILATEELSHAPSLAGHAVSVQLQLRQGSPPGSNCTTTECPFAWRIEVIGSMNNGTGIASFNQSFPCEKSGEWQVYTAWAIL